MNQRFGAFLSSIDSVTEVIDRVVQVVIVAVFVTVFALLNIQVGMRYVIQVPLIWLEELAGFLLAYLALWGSSSCIRSESHVVVTILPDRLKSDRARAWLSIVINLVVLSYLYYLTVYGYQFAAMGAGETTPSGTFDFFVPRLSVVSGGALMMIQATNSILRSISRILSPDEPRADDRDGTFSAPE